MNMTQLTELLRKSLQIAETASREQHLSTIEKDLLLSNIRKMYDLLLEWPSHASVNPTERKNTEPAHNAIPDTTVHTRQESVDYKPAPTIDETVHTNTQEQEPAPTLPVQTEQTTAPTPTIETTITKQEETVIAEEVKQNPTPEPSTTLQSSPESAKDVVIETVMAEEVKEEPASKAKPSFDDLVKKVKEQFDGTEKKPTYVAPEDDDDVPVFFSDLKFDKLFDTEYARELSERLGAAKVDDINKAMGLNEKIFTINELFGGDNASFDQAIKTLQSFATFDQAKEYIIQNIAPQYDWLSPQKFKKAKEFIKIVKRKFA